MSSLRVIGLAVDGRSESLAIDLPCPRLSWSLAADEGGQRQTACRVLVASEPDRLTVRRADVWDSGVLDDSRPTVRFGGRPLRSRTRYWWSVKAFDREGLASRWSKPSWWEMGLLLQADWTARWIGRRMATSTSPIRYSTRDVPTVVRPGHTLGQSFESDGSFTSVAIFLDEEGRGESHCVISLRRDGPAGHELDRRTAIVRPSGFFSSWLAFQEPLPAGRYYLEASEPTGHVAWRGGATAAGWVQAFSDGTPVPGGRTLHVELLSAPGPLLRKTFVLDAPIKSARLYATGVGYHEILLNGVSISQRLLDPAPTDYRKRVLYNSDDVTDLLAKGRNVIGATLGRGFFALPDASEWGWNVAPWNGEPRLLFQLEVCLVDGRNVRIESDRTWRTVAGPTLRDSIYCGQIVDARLEPLGWLRHDFVDDDWAAADELDPPGGKLVAQALPPITFSEDRPPAVRVRLPDGSRVYDAGVITAGWARCEFEGPAGAEVTLRYGERLLDGGGVQTENELIGGRAQTDVIRLPRQRRFAWEPRFSHKGFRYLQVSCPAELVHEDVLFRSVNTAVPSASEFSCSERLFEWLDGAARRTILNNLHGVPTDSPALEKNGWTGDGHLIAETAIRLFDMRAFYRKWLNDFRDAQAPDGSIPVIVPTPGFGARPDPCWSSAYPLIAWSLFEYYGDTDVLEEHFEPMRRFVDRLHRESQPHGWIWPRFSYADWQSPGHVIPPEGSALAATAFVYHASQRLASIAAAIGRATQAETYGVTARSIAVAFNKAFLDPATATYRVAAGSPYRQTSNILPLAFGLTPLALVHDVARNLASDVRDAKDGHLDAGVIGTKYLLPVLSDHGYDDVAVTVATQRTFPSWGYWREQGSDTVWEGWGDDARSRDHYALGSAVQWLHERVAGVRPTSPGFETIAIRPIRDPRITAAGVRYQSVRGEIEVTWTADEHSFQLEARVPVGVTGQLQVPAEPRDVLHLEGVPVALHSCSGWAEVPLAPGRHRIRLDRR